MDGLQNSDQATGSADSEFVLCGYGDCEKLWNILFHVRLVNNLDLIQVVGVPTFTEIKLISTASCLKNKKTPGPHGILAKARQIIQYAVYLRLRMYNACLPEGVFSALEDH